MENGAPRGVVTMEYVKEGEASGSVAVAVHILMVAVCVSITDVAVGVMVIDGASFTLFMLRRRSMS